MRTRERISVLALTALLVLAAQDVHTVAAEENPSDKKGFKPPLPDLVVFSIGLDEACQVVVGVKNGGKGPISDSVFRHGQIRVMAGSRQALIPLTRIDPKGHLKAAGGTVKGETGLKLEKEKQVRAEVDTTRKIEESDETNNDRQENLTPRCGAVGQPVAQGKTAHLETEACGVALLDLVATGGEVVVLLGRESAARLDPSEAGKIKLEVQFGAQSRMWPLVQVDPGLRRLNESGGPAKFGTGLVLEKPGPVTARLLGCEGKTLVRNLTPGGQTLGTPPPSTRRLNQSEGPAPKSSADSAPPPLSTGMVRKGAEAGIGKPTGPVMAVKEPRSDARKPTHVPRIIDRGIRIMNPTAGDRYYQGETIYVLCRITQASATSGNVTFRLVNAGTETEAGTVSIPIDRAAGVPIPLTTARDIPVGRYLIRGLNTESGAFGESDAFEFVVNSARIDFVAPARGDSHVPGSTMNVRYQLNRRVEPGTITFQFFHEGTPESTHNQGYLPEPANDSSPPTHSFLWNIPPDAPEGPYVILATHPAAIGLSSIFTISNTVHGVVIPKCDFSIEGATLADGVSFENGITVGSMSDPGAYEGSFLIAVRWNGDPPPVPGAQHAIHVRSVVTGELLGSAPTTPRFNETNADGSGLITIRFPFRIRWQDVPRMTRGRYIPLEFSLALERGLFDAVAQNNSRVLDLRVIGAQPPADFVAEIVAGSIHTEVHNVPFNTDYDCLAYRARVRFKNQARGPAAPVANVWWWFAVRYLLDDGTWRQAGYDIDRVSVPGEDWVVVDVGRDMGSRCWEGVDAIPVNYWRPMQFEIKINSSEEVYETDYGNNVNAVEMEVD